MLVLVLEDVQEVAKIMGKRAKKPRPDSTKVLPGYMASYADMFTVLMVFFVLLFSMSVIDQDMFRAFIEAFGSATAQQDAAQAAANDITVLSGNENLFDGLEGLLEYEIPPPQMPEHVDFTEATPELGLRDANTVATMMTAMLTYMAEHNPSVDIGVVTPYDPLGGYYGDGEGAGGDIRFEQGDIYVRISMPDSSAFFNSGQANLTAAAVDMLNVVGPMLYDLIYAGNIVVVEGHTDNIPIRNAQFPSNWRLSGARATAVVEHFMSSWNLDPLAIFPLGLGEYRPIDTNATPEGRANNRRVEIKIYAAEQIATDEAGNRRVSVPSVIFTIPGTA
jgi:chemotaxis protein MotB